MYEGKFFEDECLGTAFIFGFFYGFVQFPNILGIFLGLIWGLVTSFIMLGMLLFFPYRFRNVLFTIILAGIIYIMTANLWIGLPSMGGLTVID